ncbi:MFS general substrate transporter [Clavulina sp. PMI_390]|nr:MFS general substrate transporter [Clavulina sp. PMI_390]
MSDSAHDEKHSPESVEYDSADIVDTQEGVKKVEALQKVWTPGLKIALYISIALACYMYILDNGTNWAWGSYASAELGHYDLYAAIQCVQSILLAIGKPLFAKFTDVAGRAEAISIALFMYILGYIISATTPTMTGLGAGNAIWVLGFSGLQIAIQIVIADITTLQWRSLVSGLATGGWYFINFYANAKISTLMVDGPGWRWGYGIYAICYLPALLPIISILFYAQNRAKKEGLIKQEAKLPFAKRVTAFIIETDAIGLFFLAATLALIFLPMVIAGGSYATTTWQNPAIPAMMVVGGVVTLPIFVIYEIKYSTYPVVPLRLLRNRNVLIMCGINFFDFISFYLTYGQLYGFVSATTNWSYANIIYYTNGQTLSLTFSGIVWAIFVLYYKFGFRYSLNTALAVRMLGVGLMLHARTVQGEPTGELVMTQILQGFGGGVTAVASQTAAQGSVPHQDLALTTALVLLAAEVGGVIGTAAAGAINRNRLPIEIQKRFPQFNTTEVAAFVGNPALVAIDYPDLNSPNRMLMHDAFSAVQKDLVVPALVLAIVPFLLSFFVQDFAFTKVQNMVEAKAVTGDVVEGVERRENLIHEEKLAHHAANAKV